MKERLSQIVMGANANIKKILAGVVDCITTFVWTILWFPMAFKYALDQSYFSECKRKNIIQRIIENIVWVLKHHRANGFYNLYGFDRRGKSSKGYIDEKSFWNKLNKLNYKRGLTSQVCLLRDKYMFFKYMNENNLPVPQVFAVVKNGKFYSNNLIEISMSDLKAEKDYFVKDIDGECASFVKHIASYEELKGIKKQMAKGSYILQRSIHQSEEMNKLNPNSINTLRIVTVNTKGKIKVLSSLLRVGTSHTGNVDNWAAGGLAIGIQKNGYLKKYGFYKPGHGLKINVHPDSGIVFEEFKVPKLKEAYEMAIKAHKFYYNVGAIGWDIAITEDGPVFVEGNDNFEITLMQACDGPLKKEWEEL